MNGVFLSLKSNSSLPQASTASAKWYQVSSGRSKSQTVLISGTSSASSSPKHPANDAPIISRVMKIARIYSPLNRSAPSSGSITDASPSTHTLGASGLILPQLIASRNRAPERLPSCSGAVVM